MRTPITVGYFTAGKNALRRWCNQPRLFSTSTGYKETKIKVLDVEINYLETLGCSSKAPPIFFLPGALGSIEMDFKPIIPHLNTEKYRWICWDPPGYGKSYPPKRQWNSGRSVTVHLLDGDYAKEFLNILGYPKYTLLAWSGATLTSIRFASEVPEKASGLITWGGFGYSDASLTPKFEMMKKLGIDAIPEPRRIPLINMYGREYLTEMWNGWMAEADKMPFSEELKKGGTFQDKIRSVQCPSLIIHGVKDALIDVSFANHLVENLKDSRLHLMEKGTHNLHLRQTEEFVRCIEEFVDTKINVNYN